jgi:protein-disulfide isomerase
MNRRTLLVATAAAALAVFGGGTWLYTATRPAPPPPQPVAAGLPLIRDHAPVLGPANAPVTIVEFFDPACESCRAFHPVVKRIMADFPEDVRVVMRYAAFHQGSDEAVRILEAARAQDMFVPVLEALYAAQDVWAAHGAPNLDAAWQAARRAGIDQARANVDKAAPAVTAILNLDAGDVRAVGVRGTPTFFVNGKPLAEFSAEGLYHAVETAVTAARAG